MSSFLQPGDGDGSERVRVTVSVSRATREALDRLQATEDLESRSAAFELVVDHYLADRADAQLAAAARRVDAATQRSAPGVIGAGDQTGRGSSGDWAALDDDASVT